MKNSILAPFRSQIGLIAVFAIAVSTSGATSKSNGTSIAQSVDGADRAEILVRLDLKTGFREVVIVESKKWIHAFAGRLCNGAQDLSALGAAIGPPQVEFFAHGKKLLSFKRFGDNSWWIGDQSGIILTLPNVDFAALNSMLNNAKPGS